MGGERHVLQNATGKSNECQRDGSYGNSFRRWLAGQKLRGGGLCGPRGKHYLCKGVERSLWNCGARLARPYRSSIAQRMLVPLCHPCPPFPPLHPMTEPLPATLSPGVALKYLGGAVAWCRDQQGGLIYGNPVVLILGPGLSRKGQPLSGANQLDWKLLFSFSSILFNAQTGEYLNKFW